MSGVYVICSTPLKQRGPAIFTISRCPAVRVIACLTSVLALSANSLGQSLKPYDGVISQLIAAYPNFLTQQDGNNLIWIDGTKMPIDDGIADKPVEKLLETPDLKDQFHFPYVPGKPAAAPLENEDPGRIRFDPLFRKMYGDCRKGGVSGDMVQVAWLPKHNGGRVMATKINGVAAHLQEVSDELDTLPDQFMTFLMPTAGTFNCRVIAGTDRASVHAYGAAIDINTKHAHYWRNAKAGAGGTLAYQNEIPFEIVDIFERHGFIWGGKWYHYDTMHFEYRPELLPPLTR